MTKQNSESVPGKKYLKILRERKKNLYTYVYVH